MCCCQQVWKLESLLQRGIPRNIHAYKQKLVSMLETAPGFGNGREEHPQQAGLGAEAAADGLIAWPTAMGPGKSSTFQAKSAA